MAWYCDTCKRYVEGNEVDVGNIIGGPRHGNMVYHRVCFGNVRPVRDDEVVRAEAHAQEGEATDGND